MCYSAFEFPANCIYTEAYLDFVSAVVTSNYDVAVRNLHCHYRTSAVYSEYFVQRSTNDVPSMAFKNISINRSYTVILHEVRSEAKAKTFYIITALYHIQVL